MTNVVDAGQHDFKQRGAHLCNTIVMPRRGGMMPAWRLIERAHAQPASVIVIAAINKAACMMARCRALSNYQRLPEFRK